MGSGLSKMVGLLAIITFILFLIVLPGKKADFFSHLIGSFFSFCLIGIVPLLVVCYMSGVYEIELIAGFVIIALMHAIGDAHNKSRK